MAREQRIIPADMPVVAIAMFRMRILKTPEQYLTTKPGSYLWPDKIRE
jgi:hypothetical protein